MSRWSCSSSSGSLGQAVNNSPLLGWKAAIGFLIGAVASASAGFIGMNVSVRTNVRTAEAAKKGLGAALGVAFKGGAVTGLLVVGLGLLSVSGYFLILGKDAADVKPLVGLAFGSSLISVFARLGGGIFTKGADVGADLVGKVEAGIPEDDPRNPAVIADNVGDNVGDCAGMAADLFETYAVTTVAVMFLGSLFLADFAQRAHLPARPRWRLDHHLDHRDLVRARRQERVGHRRALHRPRRRGHPLDPRLPAGHLVADGRRPRTCPTAIRATGSTTSGARSSASASPSSWSASPSTSPAPSGRRSRRSPRRPRPGTATNIIAGLAVGLKATAAPIVVIGGAIAATYELAGYYGIGVAVMAQLSLTGLIVALDAFGPITDNAGGIAEMAELPDEVRAITDPLDAVGNTTKAVTKGYAIGSAGLAAVVLFVSYVEELRRSIGDAAAASLDFSLINPFVVVGLFIGGMMPFLFAAFSMEAVGKAGGQVVEEVRRQFREKPGIMEGTERPDYARCVRIVTASAQREMLLPAAIPILFPIIVAFIFGVNNGREMLGGLLLGVDRDRHLRGDLDDLRRRRVGQRQEADRGRRVRRQGLGGPRGLDHRRHGR